LFESVCRLDYNRLSLDDSTEIYSGSQNPWNTEVRC